MRRRRHRGTRARALLASGLAVTATLSFATAQAFTAANTVPATNIGQVVQSISVSQLVPTECASLGITSIVTGSGTVNATASRQLVLGSSGVDTLGDTFGSDCLVGGAGADSFSGKKSGGDLCIVSTTAGSVKNCTVVATRP